LPTVISDPVSITASSDYVLPDNVENLVILGSGNSALTGNSFDNSLAGTVKETAYVGVATQYVVETGAGTLIVYVQNDGSALSLRPGAAAILSWSPHATFVVDSAQED